MNRSGYLYREKRGVQFEPRAAGRLLTGYAARFNSPTTIGDPGFTEIIAAGAFRNTLASGRDVLALVDHDPSRLVARTRSGTLRLSEDSQGLAFEIDVPETQLGRDLLALAERGDLGGMSFAFQAARGGDHWHGNRRELRAVTLFEVSVILAHPAYGSTTVSARSGERIIRPGLALRRRILEGIS